MKKFFTLAAVAALVLSACAKVETVKVGSEDVPVVFGAYSGRNANITTKAAPIANVANLASAGGFGVFAYYTGNTAYASADVENWKEFVLGLITKEIDRDFAARQEDAESIVSEEEEDELYDDSDEDVEDDEDEDYDDEEEMTDEEGYIILD